MMKRFTAPALGEDFRPKFVRLFFACCALAAVANSSGVAITYQAENLADVTAGEDLWKYSYTVSDFEFAQNQGFTIFFEADKFRNLEAFPATPNPDWDIIVGDSIPILGLDGIYDALSIVALGAIADLSDPFTLSFTWTGPGAPGSQFFEVNQYGEDGFTILETLATGETVAATTSVPDGGSGLLLLGLAFGSLAFVRHQIGRSSVCEGRS